MNWGGPLYPHPLTNSNSFSIDRNRNGERMIANNAARDAIAANDLSAIKAMVLVWHLSPEARFFGWPLLAVAVESNALEIARFLLARGAPVDGRVEDVDDGEAQSQTPLWMAAYFGHVELVELLVRAGADIEAKAYPSQTTPLYIAAEGGHRDIVALLLDAGAQIDAPSHTNATPTYMAVQGNFRECALLLLERGANVNPRACAGESLVFVAAECGHNELLRELLARGADPDVPRSAEGESPPENFPQSAPLNTLGAGTTPLHIAAALGKVDTVRILLEEGRADATRVAWCSRRGAVTPLELAREMHHSQVVHLLAHHLDGSTTSARENEY